MAFVSMETQRGLYALRMIMAAIEATHLAYDRARKIFDRLMNNRHRAIYRALQTWKAHTVSVRINSSTMGDPFPEHHVRIGPSHVHRTLLADIADGDYLDKAPGVMIRPCESNRCGRQYLLNALVRRCGLERVVGWTPLITRSRPPYAMYMPLVGI